MTYEFFDRKADEQVLTKELEDGTVMMVMGDTTPDVVRTPPELGGITVRVLNTFNGPCAHRECRFHHRHYTLNHEHEGKQLQVCECPKNGYLWYTKRD
jgi:hypothetical protein